LPASPVIYRAFWEAARTNLRPLSQEFSAFGKNCGLLRGFETNSAAAPARKFLSLACLCIEVEEHSRKRVLMFRQLLSGGIAMLGLVVAVEQGIAGEVGGVARGGGNQCKFRMIQVGGTYQGIRFKPTTGETWQIYESRWFSIPEPGRVPPGNYEVTLLATDDGFTAFRLDRTTGATWQLKNRRWIKINEPAADRLQGEGPARHNGSRYELRMTRVGDILHVIRFEATTGQSAHIVDETYEKVPETGPVPIGDYDVSLISLDNDWRGFRLNRTTGTAWSLENTQWRQVAETDPVSAGDYEVSLVPAGNAWTAFRLDRSTGATWQDRSGQWFHLDD
jgi:hypothetical protein